FALDTTVVPPTANAYGLELGKSTWAWPSVIASLEPSSPAATQMVTPRYAAAFIASLTCVMAWCVQTSAPSAYPQLTEMTPGSFSLSCTAESNAVIQPCSLKSAKYRTMPALGQAPATTSTSSITSPSAPSCASVAVPSVLMAFTVGTAVCVCLQNFSRS